MQKTKTRIIKTISGKIKFHINLCYCKQHGISNNNPLSIINRICPAHKNFDSKIMIAVGFLRWSFNYQREEIQTILSTRGISISTGEISILSEEFLVRFYSIHKRKISKMKNLFEQRGGIILHLDGTGEAGNEIVFMAKEGDTGITMDSQIMPSESNKYIVPFLKNIQSQFGDPIVVIRDLSKQIRDAVTEVFPGVPQQICHYHFVKNLGKIIFSKKYVEFRTAIIDLKVLSKLKKIKQKECEKEITTNKNILIEAECKWVALAIEHILVIRERSSGYPFVLPYLEIMNRIKYIQTMAKKILKWNNKHHLIVKELNELSKLLNKIIQDKNINLKYIKIQKTYGWFGKIRKTLRVERNLSLNEANSKRTKAKKFKQKFRATLQQINNSGETYGGELKRFSKQITNNCKKHLNELFVEVKNNYGKVVGIIRDNNIEERGHRWSRMRIRRCTGRNRTTNEMAKYGALISIFSNIENEIYVKEVVSDIKDFVREMQDITAKEMNDARKLIKPVSHKEIIQSDDKRAKILTEFMDLFERKNTNLFARKWMSKLKLPNQVLTP